MVYKLFIFLNFVDMFTFAGKGVQSRTVITANVSGY
jgi:hypothetical protein